ncbi:MAG TPA: hypothetical protein VHJ34_00400 [Actinomycetota bacterium]|nr:hypothetical protein [Actinomycetota bacterium]
MSVVTGAGAESVLRVTVEGRFPPRALRYEVRAGGRVVGYGIPGARADEVVAITRDATVLTEPIRIRYEGPRRSAAPQPSAATDGRQAATADAGLGPLEVTRAVYDFGDEAFQPSEVGARVDIVADVHFPTGLSGGPYPLVLFMHGNHSTCYRRDETRYRWPCGDGWKPLPNYAGYDYAARALASHGFVVASVSANGVNVLGNKVEDAGMRQRGEVLEHHVDLWRQWSTTGGEPFGDAFVGKVDLDRIGTMGHSRGGEGAVWHKIVDDERDDPYGIDAVLALAPVDFTRVTITEADFAVLLPYCDGDVSDLQGVHFFDDSRYALPGDPGAKHTITAFGANHNFFNTVWSPSSGYPGAFNDGRWTSCTDRLGETDQRRMGRAYIVGFFRRYLAGERALDRMWTGASAPGWIAPARTLVSYLAPDRPARRMDVARFTDPGDLFVGDAGGAVHPTDMTVYSWCANTWETPCLSEDYAYDDIHLPGLARATLGWSTRSGVVRFEIADARSDVTRFDAFQFRAVVNPDYFANRRFELQDMSVALVDGDGDDDSVAASEVGNAALAYPLGRGRDHVILNQVRFPLRRFDGVDLDDIDAVELRFDRMRAGAIDVADAAFSRRAGP